jgi:hypothetical protein
MSYVVSENITNRLVLHKDDSVNSVKVCVEDTRPLLYIMPFVLDSVNSKIKHVYLHKRQDMFGDTVTSVLGVNTVNFNTNLDVVNAFVSKFFSIPQNKIDTERVFYLGDVDVAMSVFKSSYTCYGVNITGLIGDDEVEFNIGDDGTMCRVSYYDITKGHYMDNMTMAITFQLMSYFML